MMTENIGANYLSHHGILGQKWGVRRFQNEDGTLTEKGKKRYAKKPDKYEQDAKKYLRFLHNVKVTQQIDKSTYEQYLKTANFDIEKKIWAKRIAQDEATIKEANRLIRKYSSLATKRGYDGKEFAKKAYEHAIKLQLGNDFLDHVNMNDILFDNAVQTSNAWHNQTAVDDAIRAATMNASLGMSMGTNPFMF